MAKSPKTNAGRPVRSLPKPAVDNRSGQLDSRQQYRGSRDIATPKPTSSGGKK